MKSGRLWGVVVACVLAFALAGERAAAQEADPAEPAGEAPGENYGALALRVGRIENDLRRANGRIEELENQNRKLADELRRLVGRGDKPATTPQKPPEPAPSPTPEWKPLPSPSAEAKSPPDEAPAPFSDETPVKEALDAYLAGQYAEAEKLFEDFVAANKGAADVAVAIYYIGETYLRRSRPSEAAERYLEVSTNYPKSPAAPTAILRLGFALAQLGNAGQACAAFREAGRRYPFVKGKAERELQANRCT